MHKEVCDEALSIRTYITLRVSWGFYFSSVPFFLLGFGFFGGSFGEGFGGVLVRGFSARFFNSSLHLLWETREFSSGIIPDYS